MNKQKFFLIIFLFLFSFSFFAEPARAEPYRGEEIIFKARVIDILKEEEKETSRGEIIKQQNLLLLGIDKEFKEEEVVFNGIGYIELLNNRVYKKGDSLFVLASWDQNSEQYNYYITDPARTDALLFISIAFVLLLFLIGGFKGLRSALSLFFTFLIIIFFIVPKILDGANPVLITAVGSFFILFSIIYLTEGFNTKSHIASLSIFLSLSLVIGISWLFISIGKLSGAFSEDIFILLNAGERIVNFKGFLLAGIIIGTLGVIDDIIISQVVSAEQIIEANPHQDWKDVFKKAHKIGISHIASMTNTLFLAYAGVSLPALILFVSPDNPFSGFIQIVNNEAISTEIIRALSGSIGILLSVPLSTFLASWWLTHQAKTKQRA